MTLWVAAADDLVIQNQFDALIVIRVTREVACNWKTMECEGLHHVDREMPCFWNKISLPRKFMAEYKYSNLFTAESSFIR